MTKLGSPTRRGGEFYKRVAPIKPTGVYEEVMAELTGEAFRVEAPIRVGRELFLLEVEKLEPEVKEKNGVGILESLHADVLPLYQAEDFRGYQTALDKWQHRWNLESKLEMPVWLHDAKNVHDTFDEDAARIRSAPWIKDVACWVRDAALTTLQEWSEGWAGPGYYRGNELEWQMQLRELEGVSSEDTITMKELLRGCPRHFAYDPFSMDLNNAKADFDAFIETLKRRHIAFLNGRNKKAREAGGERSETTRQHAKYEWLARHHLLGWTNETIADWHNDRPEVTKDGITSTGAVKESNRVLKKKLGLLRLLKSKGQMDESS